MWPASVQWLSDVRAALSIEAAAKHRYLRSVGHWRHGIPRSTFYDWYSRYQEGGTSSGGWQAETAADLKQIPDKSGRRSSIWPLRSRTCRRGSSPSTSRTQRQLLSEASVYRLLKAVRLIPSPAFILMKAADRFATSDDCAQPALADRLHLPQGHRLGLVLPVHVLDDYSRYILAWKLCTTMAATDVSDTLQAALQASGLDQVKVLHLPRLLSDNGPSYVSSELSAWLENKASATSAAGLITR